MRTGMRISSFIHFSLHASISNHHHHLYVVCLQAILLILTKKCAKKRTTRFFCQWSNSFSLKTIANLVRFIKYHSWTLKNTMKKWVIPSLTWCIFDSTNTLFRPFKASNGLSLSIHTAVYHLPVKVDQQIQSTLQSGPSGGEPRRKWLKTKFRPQDFPICPSYHMRVIRFRPKALPHEVKSWRQLCLQ